MWKTPAEYKSNEKLSKTLITPSTKKYEIYKTPDTK